MKVFTFIDEKARIGAEEKEVEDKTISMKTVVLDEEKYISDRIIDTDNLDDFKLMYDLMEKYFPKKEKVDSQEGKVEDRRISLEELKANFEKLTREERSEVLEKMDNLKAKNQTAKKEEGLKNLPGDMQATLGISKDNLKKLTEDQRTTLVKQFDDILVVEKEKKKQRIIDEIIK